MSKTTRKREGTYCDIPNPAFIHKKAPGWPPHSPVWRKNSAKTSSQLGWRGEDLLGDADFEGWNLSELEDVEAGFKMLSNTSNFQTYKRTLKKPYFCSRAGGRLLYRPHPARPGAAGCGMVRNPAPDWPHKQEPKANYALLFALLATFTGPLLWAGWFVAFERQVSNWLGVSYRVHLWSGFPKLPLMSPSQILKIHGQYYSIRNVARFHHSDG